MAIYMDYQGIKGSSTTAGYANLIVLNSFSFGVSRNITTAPSTGAAREASRPVLGEIVVTKSMDIASPKLFAESVAGNLNNAVQIHVTTTTENKVTEFLVYKLANVGLRSYSVSASADGIPVESLLLDFSKLEMQFAAAGPGASGSPQTVGYDLVTQKTV